MRSGPKYVVYIATADLLRLAERDGEIRRAVAMYLADKVKNGTPMQREIAEKLLKRHLLFSINRLAAFSKPASLPILSYNAELSQCEPAEPTTSRRARWRRGWGVSTGL